MTEINKIDLLKIDAKLQARKGPKVEEQEKTAFEDQLLQTVKKLENMGNEIDAMMESNTVQLNTTTRTSLQSRKHLLNNRDSVVENFSAAGKSSIKSAKNIAAEYQAMTQKKQS